jgi:hypothetical protein
MKNYDPRAIINNIRRKINGESYEVMHPYYNGFTGDIIADQTKAGNYTCTGKIQRIDETTLEITELPLKVWTQDYKEFLEKMLVGDKDKKVDSEILDFKENHTDDTVAFTIIAAKEKIDEFEQSKLGLFGKFKLTSSFTTSNMNLFDANSRITKYATPEEILDAFYEIRLEFYSKRKALLLDNLRHEQLLLSNKARFVEEVCKGSLVVSNRKRADILADLHRRGYDLIEKTKKSREADEDVESFDDESSDAKLAKGYDYLLGMKIWNLTMEKVLQLRQELDEKIRAVDELDKRSITDIWVEDLISIEAALDERDLEKAAQLGEERKAQLKSQNLQKQRGKKVPAKSNKKKKIVVMNSKDASSDSVIELSDSDEDYVVPLQKPLKHNTMQKKDVGKVLVDGEENEMPKNKTLQKKVLEGGSGECEMLPNSFSTSSTAVQLVTNLEQKNEAEPEILFANIIPTASASSAKGAAKKRPSPKERAIEDEFDFESSSSGTKNNVEAETKKMRRVGGGNAKTAKERTKKPTTAKPPKNVVALSEIQPSSRPQRSRAAASKINYAIDLLDSEEDKEIDESDDDKESDYE